MITDLVCSLEPTPHDLVQDENAALHPDILQSTGQTNVLQSVSSKVLPHVVPPNIDSFITDLVRTRKPDPHDLSHGVRNFQADIVQSSLHSSGLQDICPTRSWHRLPPFAAGMTTDLFLIVKPPPHVLEH